MIPPSRLTELEEDEEKELKKRCGWRDGGRDGSLNAVISRAPVELINRSVFGRRTNYQFQLENYFTNPNSHLSQAAWYGSHL